MCRWDKGRISEEVILGQGGPASNDSVLRRDRRGDADPEEKPHGDGGRDGRDVANSLGTRRTPEAGRGGKAPPWSLCREHSPGHLDLRRLVSRTGEGDCLWFKVPSLLSSGIAAAGDKPEYLKSKVVYEKRAQQGSKSACSEKKTSAIFSTNKL